METMRFTYALLGISSALFGTAVAIPGQDPDLAENQFKNIQTLKGEKASDIIPSMQFMSASLKVECDFCHTEDRAADTKEEKTAARHMITMQRDINAKYFRGRNQVTCATCHAGRPHPLAVPPVPGVEVRPQRDNSVNPAQVLEAYGKAVGMAPEAPIKLEGTVTEGGKKSPVSALHSGSKFFVATHGEKGDMKIGSNGKDTWWGTQVIPPMYAEPFVRQNTIYAGPTTLPKLDGLGGAKAVIDGRDQVVVTGTLADKSRASYYFDKQTGLLSRAYFSSPTILGNMVQINDYAKYKKVGGFQVPMFMAIHAGEYDTVREFKSAKIDAKADVKLFDPQK